MDIQVHNEYLDLKQLIQKIPYCKGAIEDFIAQGVLIEGVHFRKPAGPNGKRIFFWSAIESWLKGQDFCIRADNACKN